jgi:hypothetical protein
MDMTRRIVLADRPSRLGSVGIWKIFAKDCSICVTVLLRKT